MNINNLTSLDDDFQEMTVKTKQSMAPGDMKLYDVWNDCPDTVAKELQSSERGVNFQGYNGGSMNNVVGKDGCLIENNSNLRFGEVTNMNNIYLLNKRGIAGTPYIKGDYKIDVENDLFSYEMTNDDKPNNSLVNSNNMINEHYYTPMLPKLNNSIQNPNTIIQTNIVRGGVSTRDMMRNMDYNKNCNNS